MKEFFFKSTKRLVGLIILALLLINVIGYLFDFKYISVMAAVAQVDKYQIRSELLMEAMDDVGACCSKDAADVWASGLKKRSAALQYSVMTKALKKEYASQLDKVFPNWVTGVSSPWVESYTITKCDRISANTYKYEIEFVTKTSAGPAGNYDATLTIIKEDSYYRISKIEQDKELYVYTGYTAK